MQLIPATQHPRLASSGHSSHDWAARRCRKDAVGPVDELAPRNACSALHASAAAYKSAGRP